MTTWQNELQHSTGEIEPNFPRSCVMDGSDCGHNSCPIAEPERDSEMDLRVSGSFAEGWNRLAAQINRLSELVKPHTEDTNEL